MKGRDELRKFQQMWTWLSSHPAHDRQYYINHVAKEGTSWTNSCPLCNHPLENKCNGCKMLWNSPSGNLCTDPDSPVFKWKNSGRSRADERICFASQTAVLAIKLNHELDHHAGHETLCQAA